MTEEMKKTGEDGGGAPAPDEKDTLIQKLQSQVDNLNQGIAATRDEAKAAIEAAKAATDALKKYETERKDGKKEDIELSPEDEKKFQAWAKANGVVTQKELEAERQKIAEVSAKDVASEAVSEFLEKYPEYDDDETWKKVQEEFALYKTPTDKAGYKKLLERIHKDLGGEEKSDQAKARARAEITRKDALKRGGQGGGSKDTTRQADIDAMQEKYPSLSREQIIARLDEIAEMYPDKK